MRIKDMKYVRTDVKKETERLSAMTVQAERAGSGKEMAEIRNEYLELAKHVQSMCSLCNIRFTLNTSDAFYQKEKEYYDRNMPRLAAAAMKFDRAFLRNPHLNEALDFINPNVAKVYELAIKTMDDKIVADTAKESELTTEYSKLMSETLFRFRGETLPFSVFRKYFDDENRSVRRDAMAAAGKTFARISGQLDAIYDDLVHTRHRMARKMGYDSYTEMGDYRMGRYDYGRREIKTFRQEIGQSVTPVVARLHRDRAKRLGIDRIMLYDNETYFAEGNPQPVLDKNGMFAAAQKMYHDMGTETSDFIDGMLAADAFDVFPKKGKWGGGYCTSIDDYGQPFVLANFNGSAGDVDVLTHEAGHALAFYEQFKHNLDYELGTGTMSIAEIHSMTMEFLTWRHMNEFFGARADDYRYYHLMSSLTFLPYGCQVDEFEETCYENPDLTPDERNEVWKKLDIYYRPYLNSEGVPYFEKGTRWQYQMHIYENPLYYIDYCLSQNVAHQFLLLAQNDDSAAFAKYIELVGFGGTLPFGELLDRVKLKNPFHAGTVTATAGEIEKLIDKLGKIRNEEKSRGRRHK